MTKMTDELRDDIRIVMFHMRHTAVRTINGLIKQILRKRPDLTIERVTKALNYIGNN